MPIDRHHRSEQDITGEVLSYTQNLRSKNEKIEDQRIKQESKENLSKYNRLAEGQPDIKDTDQGVNISQKKISQKTAVHSQELNRLKTLHKNAHSPYKEQKNVQNNLVDSSQGEQKEKAEQSTESSTEIKGEKTVDSKEQNLTGTEKHVGNIKKSEEIDQKAPSSYALKNTIDQKTSPLSTPSPSQNFFSSSPQKGKIKSTDQNTTRNSAESKSTEIHPLNKNVPKMEKVHDMKITTETENMGTPVKKEYINQEKGSTSEAGKNIPIQDNKEREKQIPEQPQIDRFTPQKIEKGDPSLPHKDLSYSKNTDRSEQILTRKHTDPLFTQFPEKKDPISVIKNIAHEEEQNREKFSDEGGLERFSVKKTNKSERLEENSKKKKPLPLFPFEEKKYISSQERIVQKEPDEHDSADQFPSEKQIKEPMKEQKEHAQKPTTNKESENKKQRHSSNTVTEKKSIERIPFHQAKESPVQERSTVQKEDLYEKGISKNRDTTGDAAEEKRNTPPAFLTKKQRKEMITPQESLPADKKKQKELDKLATEGGKLGKEEDSLGIAQESIKLAEYNPSTPITEFVSGKIAKSQSKKSKERLQVSGESVEIDSGQEKVSQNFSVTQAKGRSEIETEKNKTPTPNSSLDKG